MNLSYLARYGALAATLAAFSACSGSTVVAASTTTANVGYIGDVVSMNRGPVATELPNLNAAHRYVPLFPDQLATREAKDYEYIINQYGSYATIFDYPAGDKQIGTITNVGGQGCTNVLYGYGKKTFWIVAGENQIMEFQFLRKPLKRYLHRAWLRQAVR